MQTGYTNTLSPIGWFRYTLASMSTGRPAMCVSKAVAPSRCLLFISLPLSLGDASGTPARCAAAVKVHGLRAARSRRTAKLTRACPRWIIGLQTPRASLSSARSPRSLLARGPTHKQWHCSGGGAQSSSTPARGAAHAPARKRQQSSRLQRVRPWRSSRLQCARPRRSSWLPRVGGGGARGSSTHAHGRTGPRFAEAPGPDASAQPKAELAYAAGAAELPRAGALAHWRRRSSQLTPARQRRACGSHPHASGVSGDKVGDAVVEQWRRGRPPPPPCSGAPRPLMQL
jgi:hypothetical protein